MSFGFSVGDFIAVDRLITQITPSLKASVGSASDYQELQLELSGLQLVLHKVEHLKGSPTQVPAINGIKVAALNCQFVLESFSERLKKYEKSLEYGHSHGWVVDTAKKIKWEVAMKREVQDLRAYLVAHTSTLNMRISTEGLATSMIVLEEVGDSRINLERKLEGVQDAVVDVQTKIDAQNSSLLGNGSLLQKIFQILSGDILSRLDSILGLMNKVWFNNMKIMSSIVNEQIRLPAPDLQHSWAQAPVRFEDALGRLLPIPSEYDWNTLEAVILARFRTGPGHSKIWCGEYELLDSDTGHLITRHSHSEGLVPGASITMAIIIGQYADLARCPRLGCPSRDFTRSKRGGQTCNRCFAWFSKTKNVLRGPRRLEDTIIRQKTTDKMPHNTNTAGQDRQKFKNIRLSLTELPATSRQRLIESRSRKSLSGNTILKTIRRIRQNLPAIQKKMELGRVAPAYKSFCTKFKKMGPRRFHHIESNSFCSLRKDLEPRPPQEYSPVVDKTPRLTHSLASSEIFPTNKEAEFTQPIGIIIESGVRNQEIVNMTLSYMAKNYTNRASDFHQPMMNTQYVMKELYGRPQSDWTAPRTYKTSRIHAINTTTAYKPRPYRYLFNATTFTSRNAHIMSKLTQNQDNTNIITKTPSPLNSSYTAHQKLIWAARSGLTSLAKQLLENFTNKKRDINLASPVHGCTALHWAALKGHVEVVKLLVENGANVNLENFGGLKAIHFAVLGGHMEVYKVLKGDMPEEVGDIRGEEKANP